MFDSKIREETLFALLRLPVPVIPIYENFDRNLYGRIRDSLLFLATRGNPRVMLQIDSRGGDVNAGLDIYDLLMLYPGGCDGLVICSADSTGAVVLQACRKRLCARHAGVLIHHISRRSVALDDIVSDSGVKKTRASMKATQERLYTILSGRTGRTVAEIRKACLKNETMRAEEALAFGLVDEIIDGELR
jgi:ATP-dependent Clp protease protease subunit